MSKLSNISEGIAVLGLCAATVLGTEYLVEKRVKPLMPNHNKTQIVEQLPNKNTELLARMIYGEARGSTKELKIAVAQVALNRVKDKRWENTLEEVILQPKQFSCFNSGDPNYPKVWNPEKYEPEAWKDCLEIAKDVLENKYSDVSHGATHYHTIRVSPNWSRNKKPLTQIENTLFFD